MIFDGRKWRRSNTVVILPPVKGEDNPLYIRFGRICKQDDKTTRELSRLITSGPGAAPYMPSRSNPMVGD
jgi:hypothetical protein